MAEALLDIEVAYAALDRQLLMALQVVPGTTMRQAVEQSRIAERFADAGLLDAPMGIFGKRVDKPDEHLVEAGDRIEIYRALVADPMEVRRMRAARSSRPSKKRG